MVSLGVVVVVRNFRGVCAGLTGVEFYLWCAVLIVVTMIA